MNIKLANSLEGIEDPALLTLSTRIPSVPLRPASVSAFSTLSSSNGIKLRGTEILDATTVNALISQQSATNTTLDDASKQIQGVLSGQVGLTLTQCETPGGVLKPGAAAFAQELSAKYGKSVTDCVNDKLLTGNFGVRTVQDLTNNVTAQLETAKLSFQNSANSLINTGIISESVNKVGAGLILGAATYGTETVKQIMSGTGLSNLGSLNIGQIGSSITGSLTSAVTNIGSSLTTAVSNIGSSLTGAATAIGDKITGLGNMITSGSFANGIADKLTTGIADSVSGALTGLVGGAVGAVFGKLFGGGKASITIGALLGGLLPAAKRAFAQAESAILSKKMKPNQANDLSGQETAEPTSAQTLATKIQNAEYALEMADSELISARIAYNTNPTLETKTALDIAEKAYESAKQDSLSVANEVVSGEPKKQKSRNPLSRLRSGISSIGDKIQTTIQQGTAEWANITKSATLLTTLSTVGPAGLLANSSLAGSLSALSNPTKLMGNLVGNYTESLDKLKSAGGSLYGLVASGESKLKGILGGTTKGIKQPTFADKTDKNSAAVASQTMLALNSDSDTVVPPPPTIAPEASTDLTPSKFVQGIVGSIRALEKLEAERVAIEYKIEQLSAKLDSEANSFILSQIESANKTLAKIKADIKKAELLLESKSRAA